MNTTQLIGAEGAKTPAGVRSRGDPAGAESAEEALRYARGKRSAWSVNQQTTLKSYILINAFAFWLFILGYPCDILEIESVAVEGNQSCH